MYTFPAVIRWEHHDGDSIVTITPRNRSLGAEVRPYGSAREFHTDIDDTWENTFEAGVDLKVGLSSGITSDFTFNPDFGQI